MSTKHNKKRYLSILFALEHTQQCLSVRAISSKHGVSVGTVSTRIKEGKKILETEEHTIEEIEALIKECDIPVCVEEKKVPAQQVAIRKVYELATRPEGVKSKQEYAVYAEVFGYTDKGTVNIQAQQKSYIRRRCREIALSQGKKALFVPDWINPEKPSQSLHNMNVAAHELYEYVSEKVQEVIAKNNLENESAYAIKHALVNMVIEGLNPKCLERQIKGYTDIVEGLTENGVAVADNEELDYSQEWHEGKHYTVGFDNGEIYLRHTTPEAVHSVFEGLKDIEGQIY